MLKSPDIFLFNRYSIEPDRKEINFYYKYQSSFDGDREFNFTEKIILPKKIPHSVSPHLLNKVLKNLHLMLGVSYFKMYCPKKFIVPYSLTKGQADFWNTVYTKGLGEFFYRNKIDFRNLVNFPFNINKKKAEVILFPRKKRLLVGMGGGKDSIVAVEILKQQKKDITGFILETQIVSHIQREVVRKMEIDSLIVKRYLDSALLKSNQSDVLTGHIPISAIYAFIGLLLAIFYDYSLIITANEKSSNFGNVNYLGFEINHQWSKSEEFERLFKNYIKEFIAPNIDYFSILRHYSEIEITRLFVKYKKYFKVFSSCNSNFKIKSKANKKWCGKCSKCAFVFIMLAAQLPKEEVISIFGKNMLEDKSLIPLYKDLIGEGSMKPFDCVGTFEESRQALEIIKNKGEFDVSKII